MTQVDIMKLLIVCTRSRAVKKNFDEILAYFVAFNVITIFFQFWSDFTFSALLTLSAAVQCLGFVLLRLKVRKQCGVQGMSSRTLQLFGLAYVCRLYSTLQYNGYLPIDRSGDWLYQLIEVFSLCIVGSLLFAIHGEHKATYGKDYDTCSIIWFVVVAFLIAYFMHPSLNNSTYPDVSWTMALFLEAFGMLPQLWMMTKLNKEEEIRDGFAQQPGQVQGLAGHFIACVFLARLLTVTFWMNSYVELKEPNAEFNLPGVAVLGAQLLQVVIGADFMYYYICGVMQSIRSKLPTPI
jgi:hypothetical protein